MKNHAASVMAKLKNQMKKTKEPLDFLMLQYVQERFLFRLSQSEYKDNYILKGGTLFYVWADEKYRPTKDLDFMFYGKLQSDELLGQIKDICQLTFPEDGIVFDWQSFSFEEIKEEHEYDGLRIGFTARIGQSKVKMRLDVCTGDKITPQPREQLYPRLLLHHNAPSLKMYPKETVIAEKVHAMIDLDLPNSRMKDYFDVFILIRDFSAEIDHVLVAEAIKTTFSHRGMPIPTGEARVWTPYFFEDENKVTQWNAFLKRNKVSGRPSIKKTCEAIGNYINPIFEKLAGKPI